LLYSRFFTKVLRDFGYLKVGEPFTNLLTQGMVIKDGAKMSKSKGNVVDPDQLIGQYGADTVRLFSLFAAPPERDLEWNAQGVEGASRFLNRLYRFIIAFIDPGENQINGLAPGVKETGTLHRKMHQTIRKITFDIENDFHFNTAISAAMELFNVLISVTDENREEQADRTVTREALGTLLILLYPMVPHFCSEMWSIMGFASDLDHQDWPEWDAEAAREELVTIVIQVNGKVRSRIEVDAEMNDEALREKAFSDENTKRFIADKPIKKVIVVQKKLVNIVV